MNLIYIQTDHFDGLKEYSELMWFECDDFCCLHINNTILSLNNTCILNLELL